MSRSSDRIHAVPKDATGVWTSRIRDPDRNQITLQLRHRHREASAGPLSVFRAYFAADAPSAATMRLEQAAISVELPFALEELMRIATASANGRKTLGDTTVLLDGMLRLAEHDHEMRLNFTDTPHVLLWQDWRALKPHLMPKLHGWLSNAMGSILTKSQSSALSPTDREIARAFDSARTYTSGMIITEIPLFEVALHSMVGFVKNLHALNFFPH